MYHQPPGVPPYYQQSPTPAPEWQQQQQQHPVSAAQPWQTSEYPAHSAHQPPQQQQQQQQQSAGGSVYNPGIYGPMSGHPTPNLNEPMTPLSGTQQGGGFDTSHWGVKYNHQYHHQHNPSLHGQAPSNTPPALPPRPTSTVATTRVQSPGLQSTAWAPQQQPQLQQPSYYTSTQPQPVPDYQQQWSAQQYADPTYATGQAAPPPPPPIPPAYQSELQQQQQQQLAQQPASWSTPVNYAEPQSQPHLQQPPTWPAPVTYGEQPSPYNYPVPQHQYDVPQQPQQQQQPPQPQPQTTNVTTTQPAPGLMDNSTQNHVQPPGPTHENVHSPPPQAPAQAPPRTPPQAPPAAPATTAPPSLTTTSSAYVSPVIAPVAPVTAKPAPLAPGVSALGTGGPSSWEHFTASGEDIDDTQTFHFKPSPDPASKPQTKIPQEAILTSNKAEQPLTVDAAPVITTNNSPSQGSPPRKPVPTNRTDSLVSNPVSPEGMIDGAIEAWTRPVALDTKNPQPQSPLSVVDRTRTSTTSSSFGDIPRVSTPTSSQAQPTPQQTPPAPSSKAESSVPHSSVVTIVDPYADLDPFYKSSLTRYVTMLRKEMEIESDAEKFKVFTAFLVKEKKLREVLYSMEPVPETPKTVPVNPTIVDKALSASPLQAQPPMSQAPILPSDSVVAAKTDLNDTTPKSVLSSSPNQNTSNQPAYDTLQRSSTGPSRRRDTMGTTGIVSPVSAGADFPQSPPRSTSVPPENQASVVKGPAYKPFRYSQGPQRGSEILLFDRPAPQAYTALRLASVESGRVMSQPAGSPSRRNSSDLSGKVVGRPDETFVGLIREKSVAYRPPRAPQNLVSRPATADPFKKGITNAIIEELRAILPLTPPKPAEAPEVATVRKDLDEYVDDFAFIAKSLEAWDRGTDGREAALNKLRRQRQEESEHHIDALFNNKEIGYSDINVLEGEFKQTEAQRQLTEERRDFEKFDEIVFNRVDERLASEIESLQKSFEQALKLLATGTTDELAVASSNNPKFQLSHAMKLATDAFQKLELRHQKRIEAALERERRRKKAERRYYAFLGDSKALREMDRDFDTKEKRMLVEAAKAKDQRANRLMDSFDDASMQGIGENQRQLDDISAKITSLDAKNFAPGLDGPTAQKALRTLQSALNFVNFLGTDSETILNCFGVADRVLNDADYEVSVCDARLANSSAEIFRQLEEAKKKEDKKIGDDLQSRISSLKEGQQEVVSQIQSALDSMKQAGIVSLSPVQDVVELSAGSTSPPLAPPAFATPAPLPAGVSAVSPAGARLPSLVVEDSQQERLRKALEEAKKRNAARTPAP